MISLYQLSIGLCSDYSL